MIKVYHKPSVFSQYWRDTKDKFQRKVFKKFEMPWMKSKELDIIVEVVDKLQPEHVFEWGSGFSTLLLPRLLPGLKSWHSLEHNEKWYEFIKQENKDSRVFAHYQGSDNPAYNGSKKRYDAEKEGLYQDFKSYIEFPRKFDQKFDFMFIDGRARKECLKVAYELLSDRGVVIVHDANRADYFENHPPFNHVFHLEDYRKHRKQGGVWIARKTNPISEVLDMGHHEKVWLGHDRLAKVLFLR